MMWMVMQNAAAAEVAEAEELQSVISAIELSLVGRNTYLPLATQALSGLLGIESDGHASANAGS